MVVVSRLHGRSRDLSGRAALNMVLALENEGGGVVNTHEGRCESFAWALRRMTAWILSFGCHVTVSDVAAGSGAATWRGGVVSGVGARGSLVCLRTGRYSQRS
jgi:hypothetical protein